MGTYTHDVCIIGSGPAGMQAALYAATEGLRTVVVSPLDQLGGQIAHTPALENLLGLEKIAGPDFAGVMYKQGRDFGVDFADDWAIDIDSDRDIRVVQDTHHTYHARAVIVATGSRFSVPDVKGLDMTHPRVHVGPWMVNSLHYGDRILILGAGNSAVQGANKALELGAEVHVCARSTPQWSDAFGVRLESYPYFYLHSNTEVQEIVPTMFGHRAYFERKYGGSKSVNVHHIFVCVGTTPNTEWLTGWPWHKEIVLTPEGRIETGKYPYGAPDGTLHKMPTMTTQVGVFAAGDVRAGVFSSVAASMGDARFAVSDVHAYLNHQGPRSTFG